MRVTDGTDTAASYTLQGAASPAGKSVILAGTITVGQTSTLTIASASLPTNVLVGYENVSGDTLGTTATGLAAAVNANAALASVGITAQTSGDDVNVYAPSSVTFTVTGSVSSDGTLTFTSGTAAATTNGGTISGIFTGILGNQMQVKVATGTQPSTFNVTLIPPVGLSETYPNIPSATFWASLQTAINSGMSTYRGKSLCGKMTGATPAVGAPATGTYTLSGGTDGRAGVTTSILVGSETATPQTGLFALSAVSPAVGISWIVGCNDLSAPSTILSFTQSAGPSHLFPLATGTSSASAVSSWQGTGVADPSIWPLKDYVDFFDTANNVTRRVSPCAYVGGTWATLGPQQSPGNKQVAMCSGTERNDPVNGNIPYTTSEVAMLEATGIGFISNPIPRGRMFGIRHGQTSSSNPVTQPAEDLALDHVSRAERRRVHRSVCRRGAEPAAG